MREKRYFCDWLKEHEDRLLNGFWGYFAKIYIICFIVISAITMPVVVPPNNLGGIFLYIFKWMGIVIISAFIDALILSIIIFVLYLFSKESKKHKEKDKAKIEK